VFTPFAAILRQAVEENPTAIGGAFADADGEMVDSYSTIDPHDWAVITAHFGVVMAHINACFGMWHYGSPEYFISQHGKLDIVVHSVESGYFALLALRKPANLGRALQQIRAACALLQKEMQ
jgi:hypothetical protein